MRIKWGAVQISAAEVTIKAGYRDGCHMPNLDGSVEALVSGYITL